jgi:hypothetical protein
MRFPAVRTCSMAIYDRHQMCRRDREGFRVALRLPPCPTLGPRWARNRAVAGSLVKPESGLEPLTACLQAHARSVVEPEIWFQKAQVGRQPPVVSRGVAWRMFALSLHPARHTHERRHRRQDEGSRLVNRGSPSAGQRARRIGLLLNPSPCPGTRGEGRAGEALTRFARFCSGLVIGCPLAAPQTRHRMDLRGQGHDVLRGERVERGTSPDAASCSCAHQQRTRRADRRGD